MERDEELRGRLASGYVGKGVGNSHVAMTLARVMPSLTRLCQLVKATGPDGLSVQDAEALIPVARACEIALDKITRPKGQEPVPNPRRRIEEAREAIEFLRVFADDLRRGICEVESAGCDSAGPEPETGPRHVVGMSLDRRD